MSLPDKSGQASHLVRGHPNGYLRSGQSEYPTANKEYPISKVREISEHRAVLGITGQCMSPVSDVRLEIPCWLLDIEIRKYLFVWGLSGSTSGAKRNDCLPKPGNLNRLSRSVKSIRVRVAVKNARKCTKKCRDSAKRTLKRTLRRIPLNERLRPNHHNRCVIASKTPIELHTSVKSQFSAPEYFML